MKTRIAVLTSFAVSIALVAPGVEPVAQAKFGSKDNRIHVANNLGRTIYTIVTPAPEWVWADIAAGIAIDIAIGVATAGSGTAVKAATTGTKQLVTAVKGIKSFQTLKHAIDVLKNMKRVKQLLKAYDVYGYAQLALDVGEAAKLTMEANRSRGEMVKFLQSKGEAIASGAYELIFKDNFLKVWNSLNPSYWGSMNGAKTAQLMIVDESLEYFASFKTGSDHSWIATPAGVVRAKYGRIWVEDRKAGFHEWEKAEATTESGGGDWAPVGVNESAPASGRLGDVDVARACRDQHGATFSAALKGAVRGYQAAYGWVCRGPGGDKGVDLTRGCQSAFGPSASAQAKDLNDAYSWGCFGSSGGAQQGSTGGAAASSTGNQSAPRGMAGAAMATAGRLGDVDVARACASQHGGAYRAYLAGPVKAHRAAYTWKCRKGNDIRGVDLTRACQSAYGSNASAVAKDLNDAYSWGCFGSSGGAQQGSTGGAAASSGGNQSAARGVVGAAAAKTTAGGLRRVGDVDVTRGCREQHGSGYKSALNGPVRGPKAAYTWVCRGPGGNRSVDLTRTCQSMYGSQAFAEAKNLDDAYSWGCFAR